VQCKKFYVMLCYVILTQRTGPLRVLWYGFLVQPESTSALEMGWARRPHAGAHGVATKMLARGAAPRPELPPPPASEGPSLEDCQLPEHEIREQGMTGLISLVQRVQAQRVGLYGHFDDAFERLVTVGDADGYPACVDRFKSRFLAARGLRLNSVCPHAYHG
jgi:hypothetical protein